MVLDKNGRSVFFRGGKVVDNPTLLDVAQQRVASGMNLSVMVEALARKNNLLEDMEWKEPRLIDESGNEIFAEGP